MATTLRYVPKGTVSLSSDAPGWSNDEQTKKGPTCWKCKGTCVRPVQKKLKVSGGGGGDITNNASTTTKTIDTNQNNNIIINQRPCPVCKGKGHLPIKSKYISSQNNEIAGVITSRRRRPLGWKEYGHVPSAVQASLRLLDDGATNDSLMCGDKDDNAQTQDYDDDNDLIKHAISLLSQANGNDDDYESQRKDIPINLPSSSSSSPLKSAIPIWLPINRGEQLCNLVGRWRILQRVASHRWTTDDLVTAYIAASNFVKSQNCIQKRGESSETIRYLDLGTGNASVLQMVSWYLLSSSSLLSSHHHQGGNNTCNKMEAVGVEARSEAVGLARRSLAFNLGTINYQGKVYTGGGNFESTEDDNDVQTKSMEHDVQIVQGDFRNLVSLSSMIENNNDATSSDVLANNKTMKDVASQKYDLITGTPPYFRVRFTSTRNNNVNDATAITNTNTDDDDEVITSAVIEQGGMPTSIQSAPARCEFRGGIEAYCHTASALLSTPHGRFVVCENWANDGRVWAGAKEAGLAIECVYPVRGSVKKEHNLFAVYVMKKKSSNDDYDYGKVGDDGEDEQMEERNVVQPSLVVRDEHGKWTEEYAAVMESMSIPVV